MALTIEQAKELFEYDREKGEIIWRKGRRKGHRGATKYHSGFRVNIGGKMVQVAHIIWLFETGLWPIKKIKFIDGDMFNCLFSNMEEGKAFSTKRFGDPEYGYVSSFLSYDKETGIITNNSGAKVGYKGRDGYSMITLLDGSQRKYHRIAWLLATGENPKRMIDHIDGDRTNNAWSNLREVTPSQNSINSKFRKSNTSGFKGVSWDKKYQKWEAYIWVEYRKHHLGYFSCPEEASKAYVLASQEKHKEYARQ